MSDLKLISSSHVKVWRLNLSLHMEQLISPESLRLRDWAVDGLCVPLGPFRGLAVGPCVRSAEMRLYGFQSSRPTSRPFEHDPHEMGRRAGMVVSMLRPSYLLRNTLSRTWDVSVSSGRTTQAPSFPWVCEQNIFILFNHIHCFPAGQES